MAKHKLFLISSQKLPNMSGANKKNTQELFDIIDKGIVSLNRFQVS